MLVELSAEVMTGSVQPLVVLGIFAMGVEGRHRVLADSFEDSPWRGELPADLRDEIDLAIELGKQEDVLGPEVMGIRVVKEEGEWTGPFPELSPNQTMQLLSRPLRVVLENGVNDRDALFAFAPKPLRAQLEKAQHRGWLEFWNGGGIDGCQACAQQLEEISAASLRTFILSDSDRRNSGPLSGKAGKLAEIMNKVRSAIGGPTSAGARFSVQRPGHILERRAIENYLPASAYADSLKADLRSEEAEFADEIILKEDTHRFDALSLQKPERRFIVAQTLHAIDPHHHYFDMDCGREKPKDNIRTIDEVWNCLTGWQQHVLQKGIGKKKVREFYKHNSGLDEPSGEIVGILRAIWRLL